MSHPVSNKPREGINPLLVVFVLMPVLGLVAAVLILLSEQNNSVSSAGIPIAVTLPPIPSPAPIVDAPILDFTGQTVDGRTVSLSDYAGQIVFLNFWATYCIPCQKEMPAFEEFMAQQPPDGPMVITVNVEEGAEQITEFLQTYGGTTLTVVMDTDTSIADRYGVLYLPITYIVDQNGLVRYNYFGEITVDTLNDYVEALSEETAEEGQLT